MKLTTHHQCETTDCERYTTYTLTTGPDGKRNVREYEPNCVHHTYARH